MTQDKESKKIRMVTSIFSIITEMSVSVNYLSHAFAH